MTTAVIAAATAAAYLFPGAWENLCYRRADILAGEWWRLLTGHLTHGTLRQFSWDLAAFLLLGWPVEARIARGFAPLLTGCSLAIAAGLMVFLPELDWYCGLSGVDASLFTWLLLQQARRARLDRDSLALWLNGMAGIGLIGKILIEYHIGGGVFAQSPGLPTVPAAHLFGAMAGALAFLISARDSVSQRAGWVRRLAPNQT